MPASARRCMHPPACIGQQSCMSSGATLSVALTSARTLGIPVGHNGHEYLRSRPRGLGMERSRRGCGAGHAPHGCGLVHCPLGTLCVSAWFTAAIAAIALAAPPRPRSLQTRSMVRARDSDIVRCLGSVHFGSLTCMRGCLGHLVLPAGPLLVLIMNLS